MQLFDKQENEFIDVKEKEIHCHFDFQKRDYATVARNATFKGDGPNPELVNEAIYENAGQYLVEACYLYAKVRIKPNDVILVRMEQND